jgi:hypothetical protein
MKRLIVIAALGAGAVWALRARTRPPERVPFPFERVGWAEWPDRARPAGHTST